MVTDRDKMIENNIGLVHSIANRFKGRGGTMTIYSKAVA